MIPRDSGEKKMPARWTRLSLRSKGVVVLTIPLSALVIAQFAIYRVEGDVASVDRRVVRYYDSRTALSQLRTALSAAQAAVSAYETTGERQYGMVFAQARETVSQTLNRLPAQPISHSRTPGKRSELYRQVALDQREITCAFFRRVSIAGPFGWRVLGSLFYARVLRPWLEIAGYILAIAGLVMGWVDIRVVLLLLLATVGMGIVLSMAAVVLREFAEPNSPGDRRVAALFFAAIPENLGYRQLQNLWLIAGFRPS
jgi:hypothetical protein